MQGDSVDRQLRDIIHPHLKPVEAILWTGQPKPIHVAKQYIPVSAIALIFFLILFPFFRSQISIQSILEILRGNLFGNGFPNFIAPLFFLFGASVILSPALSYNRALKTIYVVTDMRMLLIKGGWFASARAFPLSDIGIPLIKMNKDGTGDFRFAPGRARKRLFVGIGDINTVSSIISENAYSKAKETVSETGRLSNSLYGFSVESPSDWETDLSKKERVKQWSEVKLTNGKGATILKP
jgi:hypothetical protein